MATPLVPVASIRHVTIRRATGSHGDVSPTSAHTDRRTRMSTISTRNAATGPLVSVNRRVYTSTDRILGTRLTVEYEVVCAAHGSLATASESSFASSVDESGPSRTADNYAGSHAATCSGFRK